MHFSLRWRIAVPFVLFILLASGLISLFLYNHFETLYLDDIRRQSKNTAGNLAYLVETAGVNLAGWENEAIDLIARQTDDPIAIIWPDGQSFSRKNWGFFEGYGDVIIPEYQSAISGQVADLIVRPKGSEARLVVFEPVIENGRVIAVFLMAPSLKTFDDRMAFSLRMILLLNLAGAVGAILLALALSNYTIRPIRQLTRAAHWMAEGDFTRVPLFNQADEIGQLSQAFNQMAGQINTQFSELTTERVKLAAVLTNMNDGIMIVDREGITRLINPACLKMFDYNGENVNGIPLVEIVRSHQIYDLWQKCLKTGQQVSETFEVASNRQFLNAIATPLSSTPPGNVLLVFQDLTRMHHLELVRRDFISNVSHELRTPLASLKALTETLREGALDDSDTAKRFLLRMEIEIDALAQIVQELLELSRIESGKVALDRHSIDPAELVQAAFERMQHQADRAGIRLSITSFEGLPPVSADRARIIQVMVNLLHNAIKFTNPGGEIVISAASRKRMVVFSIKDSGVGIDPQALPRIFERFYKVDRARSGEGTGLGLSISRHLVETHGGVIWAESQVGQGSTFYFSLPVG